MLLRMTVLMLPLQDALARGRHYGGTPSDGAAYFCMGIMALVACIWVRQGIAERRKKIDARKSQTQKGND